MLLYIHPCWLGRGAGSNFQVLRHLGGSKVGARVKRRPRVMTYVFLVGSMRGVMGSCSGQMSQFMGRGQLVKTHLRGRGKPSIDKEGMDGGVERVDAWR